MTACKRERSSCSFCGLSFALFMSRQISRTSSASYTRTPSKARVKRILLCLAGIAEYRNLCIDPWTRLYAKDRRASHGSGNHYKGNQGRDFETESGIASARRREDEGQGTAEDVRSR